MEREEFERVTQEAFDSLPVAFKESIENVHIVIEDRPTKETVEKMGLPSTSSLLGLYEGIPRTRRDSGYGVSATVPDKITLYMENIVAHAGSDAATRGKIREVLIHEIAHYFGMNEEEVRNAGY